MTEHDTLAAALVAALAEVTVVEKGRTAKIQTNKGRDYEYDYADIADVVRATRPVLAQHGIVALTPVHDHGRGLACTVTLLHTSGDRLDLGPFPFPEGRDAQATGSMVTYHRRFALVAALGMAAGDDDDGASATAAPPHTEPQREPAASIEVIDELSTIIGDLFESEQEELREWWKAERLPKKEHLTAAQVERVNGWIVAIEAQRDALAGT